MANARGPQVDAECGLIHAMGGGRENSQQTGWRRMVPPWLRPRTHEAPLAASSVATPRRAFFAAMALTLAVVCLGMWNAWSLTLDFGRLAKTEVRLERLAGTITHLDDVLTMSARLSAVTAEPGWEKRYRTSEPELDAAIAETLALAPDQQIVAALHQTAIANEKLVELEHEVFDRVRDGRPKEALALLDGLIYSQEKTVYAQGITRAVTLIHDRVDTQVRAHSERASIILVADGFAGIALLVGWLGVLRLMQKYASDRAALVLDLQQAVHARDNFLALASHELRTPLNALSLSVDAMMQSREALPDEAANRLSVVERQIRRLEASIEALLDVSRITSGRLSMEFENDVDFAAVTRETVERFADQTALAQCDVRLAGIGQPILGTWDKMRLEQVVSNLLSNAMRYGANKPIEVHVGSTDEVAELTVRDYGIGIPAEQQAAIFARFERAVSQREYRGVGLGLWIVREVVSAMDGKVSLHSRVGEGATFRVTIPRHRNSV